MHLGGESCLELPSSSESNSIDSQGEEDVLVTFDHPSTGDLEQKITSMVNSFRALAEDTGFCAHVEAVSLSAEDGKITRGTWTPVATSSRSGNGFRSNSQTPVFTPNAFASLGGAGGAAPTSTRMAWGSSGGVVGPAAYKVRSFRLSVAS